MDNKIKLYTNASGISLWKTGKSFWAWTKDEVENYETSNTAFLIDKKYIERESDLLISAGVELEIVLSNN